MIYAIIEDRKVSNLATAGTPIGENWVDVESIPVYIGDDYINGEFYRDGEKVITEEERLRNENTNIQQEAATNAEIIRILLGE